MALYGNKAQINFRFRSRYMGAIKSLATFAFIWFLLATTSQAADHEITRPYKAGELLVKYKTGAGSIERSAQLEAGLVRKAQSIGQSQIHRVMLTQDTTVEEAMAAYAADPNIEIVEPNYIIRAQTVPDDANFSQQWGLYNDGQAVRGYKGSAGIDMDAPQAWDIITDGTEVIVAVVDTGCDMQHPDLAENIWYNSEEIPDDGFDNDGNGYVDDVVGWDFADGDNNPYDASGHGTHVAGIIAAVGNNQKGIAGVAWRARIMPVRIMNAFDEGTTADAIKAIGYAVANGAKIINCSWGGSGNSNALRHVIENADALFVCASGNYGQNADSTPYYPAGYTSANIISVAASDPLDQLAWFSNFGKTSVDVAAPGVRIYSLRNGRSSLWQDTLDDGIDGWASGGPNNYWAVADPPGRTNAPALASSPTENYANDTNAWVQLPVQDLSTASACMLSFKVTGQSEADADTLFLEISTNGNSWSPLPLKMGGTIRYGGISGSVPYWTTAVADLGSWDGEPQVLLRFRFYSGAATTGTGFYIDNMNLTAANANGAYQFMQGTSMAAGFVSGLAALIQSEDPSLTPLEAKFIIETSVDLDQNLLSMVSSGGRVNSYNALTLLRELSLYADQLNSDNIQLSWITGTPLKGRIDIQRRPQDQLEFSTIANVDAATNQYVDDTIVPTEVYFYRVQAQTLDGLDGYSHQTSLIVTEAPPVGSSSGSGGGGGGCFIQLLKEP
jgi:subtilisin family serine protease